MAESRVKKPCCKQVAQVHFDLLEDVHVTDDVFKAAQVLVDLRKDLLAYVSRLVHLKTGGLASSVSETTFLHAYFNDGQKGPGVAARTGLRRLFDHRRSLIVVVANFSDLSTDTSTGSAAEYVIPNSPVGHTWREMTLQRDVPAAFAGREPILAWEAKAYRSV